MTKHFQNLANFIHEMNSSNSTNHKIDILKKYSGDTFICDVLKYTYHPYKQYGVTSANLKKRSDLTAAVDVYDNLFYLLDDLSDRNITGHTAIEAVNNFEDEIFQSFTKYFIPCVVTLALLDQNSKAI